MIGDLARVAGAPAADRPCWHCHWFNGMQPGGYHARCIDHRGKLHIQATPERGCVYWLREPGADDEPGPPPAPAL